MMHTALVSVLLVAANAKLFSADRQVQTNLWNEFKTQFGKKYSSTDESRRFAVFVENLKVIDARNSDEAAHGGTAVHGITRFSDLSESEFSKMYLMHAGIPKKNTTSVVDVSALKATSATNADWRNVYTTPVKDQGGCGSCWAFSATEQIESDTMRQFGMTFVLSPEQIVQCEPVWYGCGGGWPYAGYDYVKDFGGITTEAYYPYTSSNGVTGVCHDNVDQSVVTVSSYSHFEGSTSKIESDMGAYMLASGPISICVDASTWSSYRGGVMTNCGKSINHAVQAVGLNMDANPPYWIVRNSWAESWGEDGYIRVAYGSNTCGLTYDSTVTVTALV